MQVSSCRLILQVDLGEFPAASSSLTKELMCAFHYEDISINVHLILPPPFVQPSACILTFPHVLMETQKECDYFVVRSCAEFKLRVLVVRDIKFLTKCSLLGKIGYYGNKLIAVVRQQFLMGINCSIFLHRNSFRANQLLALTRKSSKIMQVSHCAVQWV